MLLLISCYLGVTILNNKKQYFTIKPNCSQLFKKADSYKKKLDQLNTINTLKTYNVNKELNNRLNNRLKFLLEIYTISHICSGQQVVFDNINDINIDLLERAIKELSVECHKKVLDCYKHKLIYNIKLFISSKIKYYIYNTEAFNRDESNIIPINYFIQTLKKQINENKSILLDDYDSNPLLKTYEDNFLSILLNLTQDISSLDKVQLDVHTNSFLNVYNHIYTIYAKNIDLQKDVNMSIINSNEPTTTLSRDELEQQTIDKKKNIELNGPTDIFSSKYLKDLEDKLLDIYLEDINKVIELIGSSNTNKLNLVEINSIKTFFNNFHKTLTEQERTSNKIKLKIDINVHLLETIKSNNKKYN